MKVVRTLNLLNRAGVRTVGPPRFARGKNKGRVIPTASAKPRVVKCSVCGLPSMRGLQPLIAVDGIDGKTYRHRNCPSGIVTTLFRKLLRKKDEDEEERKDMPLSGRRDTRSWPRKRGRK